MIINVSIKSKKTVGLPHIQSLVALIFKDEGGFSQSSLEFSSSRGVWQVGKCKKMRENEEEKEKRENSYPAAVYSANKKKENFSTRFNLSFYSAQISKNTQIPSIPIIHEGQNWENHKKEVKWGSTEQKKKMQEAFSQAANFRQCSIFQHFLLFFPFGF